MKHGVTIALALLVAGCGGVDGGDLEEAGEPIASDSEAIINGWTQWVSEEPTAYFGTCGQDAAGAIGAGCRGSYCDDMRLYCGPLPRGFTRIPGNNIWWSPHWISEEFPNNSVGCPVDHVMDGLMASGSYADNIRIRCSPTTFPPTVNCKWMPYFSEENGGTQWFDYDVMSLAAGVAVAVQCSGRYCDNMSYYICEPRCTSDADCIGSCNVTSGRCVVG